MDRRYQKCFVTSSSSTAKSSISEREFGTEIPPITQPLQPNVEEVQRDWSQLPLDILETILTSLEEDIRPFNRVCKGWYSIKDPGEWDHFKFPRHPLQFPVADSQWLLKKSCYGSGFNFFHPMYRGVRFSREILQEEMRCGVPRYSKNGWLLMSVGQHVMIIVNLFDENKMIRLPDLAEPYNFDGIVFFSSMVFAISGILDHFVIIATLTQGKNQWTFLTYDNRTPFLMSRSTPVFRKEMVYCLGMHGNLGVYDPQKAEWTIFEEPRKHHRSEENYLVDLNGELLSVTLGRLGAWISVLKLNEIRMEWEKVYTLENNAMFISIPVSFSRNDVLDTMRNKIFLPRFYQGSIVFYSMVTKKFHTFQTNLNSENLTQLEIAHDVDNCWIEPRLGGYEEMVEWLKESALEEED